MSSPDKQSISHDADEWLDTYESTLKTWLGRRKAGGESPHISSEAKQAGAASDTRKNEAEDFFRDLQYAELAVLMLQAPDDAWPYLRQLAVMNDDYEQHRFELQRLMQRKIASPHEDQELVAPIQERLDSALLARIKRLRDRHRRWVTAALIAAVATAVVMLVAIVAWMWVAFGPDRTPDPAQLWLAAGSVLLASVATSWLAGSVTRGSSMLGVVPVIAPPALALLASVLVLVFSDGGRAVKASAVAVVLGALITAGLAIGSSRPSRGYGANQAMLQESLGLPPPPAGQARGDPGALFDSLGGEIIRRTDVEHRRAVRWQWTHILLGGAAAFASGAAAIAVTEQNLTDSLKAAIGILAISGAALSALLAALNPGRRSETAALTEEGCAALSREVIVMRRLDLADYSEEEKREALEDVVDRFEKVIGLPERNSFWRRRRRRRIRSGAPQTRRTAPVQQD